MQASCDLPAACPSAACAAVFVPYMADCTAMVAATPGVPVADFQSLAASCEELLVGAGEMLQPVAVQMFRVLVDTEGAVHQAGAMFPGGEVGSGGGGGQPLDPLRPVPPPPPDVAGGDETGVTQYHAVCTSADIASCVPACNAQHHGYELWRPSTAQTRSSAATSRTGCSPGWARRRRAASSGLTLQAS